MTLPRDNKQHLRITTTYTTNNCQ